MGIALYRKYRPRGFDGVVGQPHITATLINQIKSGRVGHAYLFCGSRGVGKTSLARIFARAISCTDTGYAPCGKCEACKALSAENNLDIIEIDAASNNGVDDARDLREKVKYPPVIGKYKVYIIDEVHMLSGSAFNALLKTLEEPPAHAVFILATTEAHKLPATILSRCMRFDFKLVGMELLCDLLINIFKKEGKEAQPDAVRAIAAAAEGSVRDALSLADTCLNLSDGILTVAEVSEVLGGDSRQTELLLAALASGDIKGALMLVGGLYDGGKSMTVIAKELAHYARDLMVAKSAPAVLKTTNERLAFLKNECEGHTVEGLAALVTMFSELDSVLRYSVSPRIAMEAAVIRAVKLYSLDLVALDQRLLRIENRLSGGAAGETVPPFSGNVNSSHNVNNSNSDINNGNSIPSYAANNSVSSGNSSENSAANNNINSSHAVNSTASNVSPPPSVNNVSSGSGGTSSSPSLTAAQLWGRIITYFRRNSTPALTQVIGRQNPTRLSLKKDSLLIAASREDYLMMCDDQLLSVLAAALKSEGYNLKVSVDKDARDVDMEKEVARLEAEVGKDKINIVKK